jgi:Na+/H+ antiporter NhaA
VIGLYSAGDLVHVLLLVGLLLLLLACLPSGLGLGDLLVVGVAASIGFTVALFFATAAFPAGPLLAEAKMSALLSFAAAPLAFAVGRLRRVRSSDATVS